jgi:polyferredoxin
MDKMGYARGLVKYTTENAMKNKWTQAQTWRHIFRPRILIYTTILAAIVIAMMVSLSMRTPFKVNVVRDRGVMARVVSGGKTENVYQLQVMNATEATQRYEITVTGLPGLTVTSESLVVVESTQARKLAVRVQAPFEAAAPGSHPIVFQIDSLDSPGHLSEKSVFLISK